MLSPELILSASKELEDATNLDAFILKYHKVDDPDVIYLVILAKWKKIQIEDNKKYKIILTKDFLRQYQLYSDLKVKKLIVLSMFFILQSFYEPMTKIKENDLANEILELGQSIDETDPQISLAMIEAYWRKARQLGDKDNYKSDYFYNRIIQLSQYLSPELGHIYQLNAKVAQLLLSLQLKKEIGKDLFNLFSALPDHIAEETQQYLLALLYAYLDHIVSLSTRVNSRDDLELLSEMIELPVFLSLLNSALSTGITSDILQHMTYLFWKEQDIERADILVYEYLRNENKSLIEIQDNNYKFKIADDTNIHDFNDYLASHYDGFAQKEKYRKLFKVNRKNIVL